MNYVWIATTPETPWKLRGHPPATEAEPTLWVVGEAQQTWKGFGGCFNELGWKALNSLNPADRETILEDLFSAETGCGFNYCRMPIGANDYAESWYSHAEYPGDFGMEHFSIERDHRYLIPYIRAAQKYMAQPFLFASPWSPPTWLKHPQAYNYGRLIWEPEYLKAYARYFVRFVEAFAREGIHIDAIHVQNEPNSDQKFPSCLWTGEQMRDFIRDYLGPAFQQERLDCQIWVGTIERADVNAWAQLILSEEAARQYISGVGYQWAGKGAVQRTRMAWPETPVVQTEKEFGDGENSWEYAFYVFDLIHHYVTNGVEAYVYWNMALEEGGLSTWGWRQNSLISINVQEKRYQYNPEYFVLKHFARFIPPGSMVLKAGGRWAGNALAFRRPDGNRVFVVRNPFGEAVEVCLEGEKGRLAFRMEARSIHTLVEVG